MSFILNRLSTFRISSSACIYRPLPGLRSLQLVSFLGSSSPRTRIRFLMGLPPPEGSLPAALTGCDGSRGTTPLQRSACDDAEVSLSPLPILAPPLLPHGYHGCGLDSRLGSSMSGSEQRESKRRSAIQFLRFSIEHLFYSWSKEKALQPSVARPLPGS